MSLEQTLERIDKDLANGDLGKARDRLHGLLASHPGNLLLRRKLGDVYAKLQFPSMAGRYWYLEEEKSPEMVAACAVFEKECGNSPVVLLLAIKYKADPAAIKDTYAGRTLRALQEQAVKKYGYSIEAGKRGTAKYPHSAKTRLFGRCILWSIMIITLLLIVIGAITIAVWLSSFF